MTTDEIKRNVTLTDVLHRFCVAKGCSFNFIIGGEETTKNVIKWPYWSDLTMHGRDAYTQAVSVYNKIDL